MWPFTKKPDAFAEALRAYIDKDFDVFTAGADAPNPKEIQDFETATGVRLPQDFRDYSTSRLGGAYVQAKEAVWPRPTEHQIAPFWSFLYGIFVFGFSRAIPESMDIRVQTELFRRESGTLYVPCLKRLMDPDIYCFDNEGILRRWDHETQEAAPQDLTFTQLFAQELAELRKRKDRKLAENKIRT
jgi:hypothetical protein